MFDYAKIIYARLHTRAVQLKCDVYSASKRSEHRKSPLSQKSLYKYTCMPPCAQTVCRHFENMLSALPLVFQIGVEIVRLPGNIRWQSALTKLDLLTGTWICSGNEDAIAGITVAAGPLIPILFSFSALWSILLFVRNANWFSMTCSFWKSESPFMRETTSSTPIVIADCHTPSQFMQCL